ncbi:MAG: HAMP domain-containing histidine kinase [Ruminococcaceae bacterium]|nr:HAMP domain-containing histidine kinase [Oscillospiraceae bacterium]
MKHSITLKFLAVFLAALSLVSAVGSAAAIYALESADLYVIGTDEVQEPLYRTIAEDVATAFTDRYAATNLGNLKELPYTLGRELFPDPRDRADAEHWFITLEQEGTLLAQAGVPSESYGYIRTLTIAPLYFEAYLPVEEEEEEPPAAPTDPTGPSQPLPTEPAEPVRPENYLYTSQENYFHGGRFVTYTLDYYQAPEYTVTVYMREDVLDNSLLYLLITIYPQRFTFIVTLVLALLLAAICMVYLLTSAGWAADGTVTPGGLNRLPLDLYAAVVIASTVGLGWLFVTLWNWGQSEGLHLGNLTLMGVNLLGIFVLVISFFCALAAQIKAKDAFWWHHSIIGWICGRIGAFFRLLGRALAAVRRIMPLMAQWFIIAGILAVIAAVLLILAWNGSALCIFLLVLDILACMALVLYSGWCFAKLIKGVTCMTQGELGHRVDTRYLVGNFRDFALRLNSLSEAAVTAAQRHMRSERMKSELITNVSHDIKTPLTSIINFVDLLQKAQTEEQRQEYLEVLARQSGRMKRLIEDLMELSKASSGSIAVNLQELDAAETVNQALGEFSDKLESAGLTPVFITPREPLMIRADGRLMWRVLSNLLSNAVKYALPGTRLYVDLLQAEEHVLLSLKNISREPLTVDAEELLERFVRGDTARNSEGSGLGLNIAKNLMEVQGGSLQLLLDGDLFKVTLVFPAAPRSAGPTEADE